MLLLKTAQEYIPMDNSMLDSNEDKSKSLGKDVLTMSGGAAAGLYGTKKYIKTRNETPNYKNMSRDYKQRLKDIIKFEETAEMTDGLKALAKKHKAYNASALKAVLKDEYKPVVKARRYGALGIIGTAAALYGAKKTMDDINPHPVLDTI